MKGEGNKLKTSALPTVPDGGRFNGVDLWKLILSFGVIAIHTSPMFGYADSPAYPVYAVAVSLAVPFFFLAGGFFLGRKFREPFAAAENVRVIRTALLKYIKLYLIWSAVYLPLAFLNPDWRGKSAGYKILSYLHGLLLRGEHYNSWHLWYLLSVIFVLIALLVLCRLRLKRSAVYGICFAVWAVGLFAMSLSRLPQTPPVLAPILPLFRYTIQDGRICTGFLYVPLGMLFSRKVPNRALSLAMFAAGFAAACLLSPAFLREPALALAAAGLFCTAQGMRLRKDNLYPLLRGMSKWIYFLHMYIWTALSYLVFGEETLGVEAFLLTSIVSAAAAVGIEMIVRKRKASAARKG